MNFFTPNECNVPVFIHNKTLLTKNLQAKWLMATKKRVAMRISLFFVLFIAGFVHIGLAAVGISGRVTDADGRALSGVSIILKGATNGTSNE